MIDIQLTGLVKEFEVGRRILDGFSLQVDEGERVGLLGKNGAGKTTLFKSSPASWIGTTARSTLPLARGWDSSLRSRCTLRTIP